MLIGTVVLFNATEEPPLPLLAKLLVKVSNEHTLKTNSACWSLTLCFKTSDFIATYLDTSIHLASHR